MHMCECICVHIIGVYVLYNHVLLSFCTIVIWLNTMIDVLLQAAVEAEERKEVNCCCCVSGTVNAKVNINKTGFVPGENIIINAEVKNDCNSDVDKTVVAIKQVIIYSYD